MALGATAGVARGGGGGSGGGGGLGLGSTSVRQFHSTRPAEKRDFYEVLGLGREADKSEVRDKKQETETRDSEGREK